MGKSIRSKREKKLRAIKRSKNSVKEQAKLLNVVKNLPIYQSKEEEEEKKMMMDGGEENTPSGGFIKEQELTAEQYVLSKVSSKKEKAREGEMEVDDSTSNESKYTKYTKTQLKRRKERMTLKRKGITNKKRFQFK
eukprot:Nk52_evm1s1019 gene=Nk52_evmTU1s1019